MQSSEAPFFNRRHAAQGARLLTIVFAMLGALFCGFDLRRDSRISVVAATCVATVVLLSVVVSALVRNFWSGLKPLLSGLALGLLNFAIAVLLARADA